jgi:hypothetical protein
MPERHRGLVPAGTTHVYQRVFLPIVALDERWSLAPSNAAMAMECLANVFCQKMGSRQEELELRRRFKQFLAAKVFSGSWRGKNATESRVYQVNHHAKPDGLATEIIDAWREWCDSPEGRADLKSSPTTAIVTGRIFEDCPESATSMISDVLPACERALSDARYERPVAKTLLDILNEPRWPKATGSRDAFQQHGGDASGSDTSVRNRLNEKIVSLYAHLRSRSLLAIAGRFAKPVASKYADSPECVAPVALGTKRVNLPAGTRLIAQMAAEAEEKVGMPPGAGHALRFFHNRRRAIAVFVGCAQIVRETVAMSLDVQCPCCERSIAVVIKDTALSTICIHCGELFRIG